MFEDDDDINFDDENFLNEVFAVADASSKIRGQEVASEKAFNQNIFNSSKGTQNLLKNVCLKSRSGPHQVRNIKNDETNTDEINFFEDDFFDDKVKNIENDRARKDVVNPLKDDFNAGQGGNSENDKLRKDEGSFFEDDFLNDEVKNNENDRARKDVVNVLKDDFNDGQVGNSKNDKLSKDEGNFFEDDFTDDFDDCFSEQTIANLEQTFSDQKGYGNADNIKSTKCVESTTKGKSTLVRECRLSKCDSLERPYQDEKNQSSVSWKRRKYSSLEEEENKRTHKRHSSELANEKTIEPGNSSEKRSKEIKLSSSHNKNSYKSSNVQVPEKNTSPQGQLVQQRRFPGPAGLLPKLGEKKDGSKVQNIIQEKVSPNVSTENIICSQSSANDFYHGAWRQMVEDLDFNESSPKCPLSVFNIRWVLKRAALRGQAALRKVPFLAVLVKSVDLTHTHATAVLRDKTGEMNGTIASQVLEEHLGNIQAGDLFVLRNVTILSPIGIRKCLGGRDLHKKHYLNITTNAVVMVYHRNESGGFHATSFFELNLQEVLQEAATPTYSLGRRSVIEEEEEEETVVQNSEGAHEQTGLYSNFYNKNSSYPNSSNSNFYNSANNSYYNAPYRRENNVRMMSPNLSVRNQGSVMQPIRPQRLSLTNVNINQSPSSQGHTRPSGFIRNSAPVAAPYRNPFMSSSVNKSIAPSNEYSESSGNGQSSRGSGQGKFIFQPKVTSAGLQQKSSFNDTNPEIDQLLDGIDEDSLFGDF